MDAGRQLPFKRIAFIGNYLLCQCGIGTFTTDLCEAAAERQAYQALFFMRTYFCSI
jgi:hypothetical protein